VIVTNREILALKERPQSIVIIGGGVIGMEFASFYNSLGTEVTVVEMLPEILGGLDGEVSVMLREVYAKRGIQFRLSCKVTEVRGNEVIYVDAEGNTASATGEKILMSVGRRAVTANLGLETIGVELERGAVRTDAQLRTNVPNVFAAGDINGFSMLEEDEAGEAHHTVFLGDVLRLIHVDLADLDVCMLCGDLLQNGDEHTAGGAPCRPKIDDDQLVTLQYFAVKHVCRQFCNSHAMNLLCRCVVVSCLS